MKHPLKALGGRRSLAWVSAAISLPLIALGVQSAASHVVRWVSPPVPAPTTQLAETELELGRLGFRITLLQAVHFRGPGVTSYLMVLRHRSVDAEQYPGQSDQVRVYDLSPGQHHLHLAVLLEPVPRASDPSGRQAQVVDLALVGDYDNSGFADAMVSFASQTPSEPLYPRPLLVRWRPERAAYQVEPLFPDRPTLPRRSGSLYGTVARSIYFKPSLFEDAVTGTRMKSFTAGETMAIRLVAGQPYIVHVYVLRAHYANVPEEVQVVLSDLYYGSPSAIAVNCASELLTAPPTRGMANMALVMRNAFNTLLSKASSGCP